MKKRSGFKVIAVICVIMLLLVGGTVTAVYIMFPPSKIKALVISQIEKVLGRQVTYDKAGITLYPALGISVNGLQIANTQRVGFSHEPFLKIGRFRARISLGSIFKGYPEITKIIISKPEVLIEVDKKGSFNFDDLALLAKDTTRKEPSPSAGKGLPMLPVPITLKKFAIENGTIIYADQKAGSQIVIGAVNQEASFSIDRALKDITTSGSLRLSEVSVKTNATKQPLKNLTLTLSHDIGADLVAGTITVNQVRLSLQKIFLNLKGTVKNALSGAPELDLTVNTDPIAIGDALREIPAELFPEVVKLSAAGTAEIGVTIKGAVAPGKPFPFQGKLSLKSVMIKDSDLPQAINDCNADIAFTDNSLSVNTLKLRFGSNPIDIKGSVTNFAKPFIDAAVLADIKLSDVKEIVKLPQESTLDGEIAADIKARGEADPSNPSKLDLKGSVDLKNVRVLWAPFLKPALMNGKFTLSSNAVGENIAVAIGRSSLTMGATVTSYLSLFLPDPTKKRPRPTLDFKMASPLLDFDEIIKPPAAEKTGEKNAEKAGGPMIAPLPGVDMKGLVTAQKIVYRGTTMSNMTAKITVINDILDVVIATGFGGGQLGETLHANLANVNNVSFTNSFTVKNVELHDLMDRFSSYIKPVTPLNREFVQIDKSLFGRISLQSSVSGSGATSDEIMKAMGGNIAVQMASGRIENAPFQKVMQSEFTRLLKTDKIGNFNVMNFRDLGATIRLANSRALFDDLKIHSDIGDWAARGSVGFDALMDMAVSTHLSKEISDRLIAATEGVAKGAAKKFLQGSQFAGLVDNLNLFPRDKDGKIPIDFKLGGPVAKPQVTSIGFGQASAQPASAQQSAAKPPIQQQATQAVQQKKQEVEQQVQQTKQVIKKDEELLKQKAQEKLKGIFKR
jgi:hypothetical protein